MDFKLLAMPLAMAVCSTFAQTATDWEQQLEYVSTDDDFDGENWEGNYELLTDLAANPIDINSAKREDLEQLPFLSQQQIMDIQYYVYKYGGIKTATELTLIPSLDYDTARMLRPFISFGEFVEPESEYKTPMKHELVVYGKIPMYDRAGDKDGYLGYKYKHWIKYDLKINDNIRAGIVGSQDSGEPFLANKNNLGYDYYSIYFLAKDLGKMETFAIGRYKLSFGMGLVTNTGFSLGKISMLQNLGRQQNQIRAYSSRTEGKYFQGAAAMLRVSENVKISGFVSYRKLDATLNSDSTAATLLYTGYHRTETEMEKKHNTTATMAGTNLSLSVSDLDIGATILYSHLDRELVPKTSSAYRKYYAAGQDFLNSSVNYSWHHYPFAVNGETAIDKNGHFATINTSSVQISSYLSIMLLYRMYSYKYTSLYANSFSEVSSVQNESGFYFGANWTPNRKFKLSVYADYAHFPYLRYQVSSPSDAFDSMIQGEFRRGAWTLKTRYRLHLKQKDYTDDYDNTILINRLEHKFRFSAEYSSGEWTSQTLVDCSLIDIKYPASAEEEGTTHGVMIGESLCWKRDLGNGSKFDIYLSGKYFNSEDYNSRLYGYERGMLYSYGSASYYGEGIRYAIAGKWYINSNIMVSAKVGVTNYFDRSTIGTDLQQIEASSQTDVELQLRLKL